LNKIDKITHEKILEKIVEYKDLYDFKEIIPVSALKIGIYARLTGMQTSRIQYGRWEHKIMRLKPTCFNCRLFSVFGGCADFLKMKGYAYA